MIAAQELPYHLAALLTLFGDVLVVTNVAEQFVLMVDKALRTRDVTLTTLTFETTRVIFCTWKNTWVHLSKLSLETKRYALRITNYNYLESIGYNA